jgi:hypothetical protein
MLFGAGGEDGIEREIADPGLAIVAADAIPIRHRRHR